MTARAISDDVPVRIGKRHAVLTMGRSGVLGLKYPKTDYVPIQVSTVQHIVVGSSMVGIVFGTPFQLGLPPLKPVRSVVITNGSKSPDVWQDVLRRLASAPCCIDAREAPFLSTVCSRHSVQVVGKDTVVVWHTSTRCTVALNIHMVFMQRTKGGMATYDIHTLCDNEERPITVELLPHSTLDTWEAVLGAGKVYDFGADPIPASLLTSMYREVMAEVRRDECDVISSAEEEGSGSDSEWSRDGRRTSSDDSMSDAESLSESAPESCSDSQED
jgi:hypothetical protein